MQAAAIQARLPQSSGLGLRAAAIGYVALMVLIPLCAIGARSMEGGWHGFWSEVVRPEALSALRITLWTSLLAAAINTVMGTATAFALVRCRVPGRGLLNVLIDLPVALPTIVTGLTLVVLYGPQSVVGGWLAARGVQVVFAPAGIVLALLFVTFPFVVRAVQPVLQELSTEVEHAAWTLGATGWQTFRRVVLPAIRPAALTGATLCFARAVGEFGSVILVAGNIPFRSETASIYIYGQVEGFNARGATAVSMVLLLAAFVLLFVFSLLQARVESTRR